MGLDSGTASQRKYKQLFPLISLKMISVGIAPYQAHTAIMENSNK